MESFLYIFILGVMNDAPCCGWTDYLPGLFICHATANVCKTHIWSNQSWCLMHRIRRITSSHTGWPHWPLWFFIIFCPQDLVFRRPVAPCGHSPPAALRPCVACRWLRSSFASGWWRGATVTAAYRTAWESCTAGSPSASTRRSPRQRTTPTWSCRQWACPCLWGCCSSAPGATRWLSWRGRWDTTWTVRVIWHGDGFR